MEPIRFENGGEEVPAPFGCGKELASRLDELWQIHVDPVNEVVVDPTETSLESRVQIVDGGSWVLREESTVDIQS